MPTSDKPTHPVSIGEVDWHYVVIQFPDGSMLHIPWPPGHPLDVAAVEWSDGVTGWRPWVPPKKDGE